MAKSLRMKLALLQAARWSGSAFGDIFYIGCRGVTLVMRQTISILFAAGLLILVLHAPVMSLRTWLVAILATVPMDERQRAWERKQERLAKHTTTTTSKLSHPTVHASQTATAVVRTRVHGEGSKAIQ